MAAAPRRPDFEGDGETKPRNRRTYQKPAKDKPFGKSNHEEKGPRGRKRAFDEDDDPESDDFDDDFDDDLDPDDLEEEDLDFEDLDDDDFEGGWGDDLDDDR